MSDNSSTGSQAMQRAASLMELPPVLAELGVELGTVLEGTGIVASDLRPDAFVPFAAFQLVLDRAAALSGCDDIGLRIGRRQSLARLVPMADLMRNAPTLGEALSDFVTLQPRNSTGAAVYLLRRANQVAFGYGVYGSAGRVSPHLHDLALATGCAMIAELTQGEVRPQEIVSVRATPDNLEPYFALGACPISFGQSQTCLYLPLANMGCELGTADAARHDQMLEQIASQRMLHPLNITDRVMHALRALLVEKRSDMPEVSRRLNLQPRTLRRMLEREGRTFEMIRDEVRYAVARELLSLTTLPISDIGMTVGFSTPSSFVHAFRRWSTMTPTFWRQQLTVA